MCIGAFLSLRLAGILHSLVPPSGLTGVSPGKQIVHEQMSPHLSQRKLHATSPVGFCSLAYDIWIHNSELSDVYCTEPGLGLKAVWYGAEQFGNIIGFKKKRNKSSITLAPVCRATHSDYLST